MLRRSVQYNVLEVYDGSLVRSTCTFDNQGALADPNIVIVRVRDPRANVETFTYGEDPEVARTSLGIYYCEKLLSEPGLWWWQWDAVGAVVEEMPVRVLGTIIAAS